MPIFMSLVLNVLIVGTYEVAKLLISIAHIARWLSCVDLVTKHDTTAWMSKVGILSKPSDLPLDFSLQSYNRTWTR